MHHIPDICIDDNIGIEVKSMLWQLLDNKEVKDSSGWHLFAVVAVAVAVIAPAVVAVAELHLEKG